MKKTDIGEKWIRAGAFLCISVSILLVFFAVIFTPDFVAHRLSSDGVLEQETI